MEYMEAEEGTALLDPIEYWLAEHGTERALLEQDLLQPRTEYCEDEPGSHDLPVLCFSLRIFARHITHLKIHQKE